MQEEWFSLKKKNHTLNKVTRACASGRNQENRAALRCTTLFRTLIDRAGALWKARAGITFTCGASVNLGAWGPSLWKMPEKNLQSDHSPSRGAYRLSDQCRKHDIISTNTHIRRFLFFLPFSYLGDRLHVRALKDESTKYLL